MQKSSVVRRPDLIKPYIPPPPVHQEDLPPDYLALLSLIFGLVSITAKYKIAAWAGLFALLASMANVKKSEMDLKQITCSVTFSTMGLFMIYFRHEMPRNAFAGSQGQ